MQFIVTAGPTREHIDPVRFLSNPSTGRMGFAVARAARAAGHAVTLVAGPVALKTPPGVRRVDVVSSREMLAAVRAAVAGADVLVMTAAVADWRPARCAKKKLKKSEMTDTLKLVRNPDILKSVRGPRIRIGFAAETGLPDAEAARKCREKNLDLVVGNDVTRPGAGFDVDTNIVTFVTNEKQETLPCLPKTQVAEELLDRAMAIFQMIKFQN